MSNKKKNKKVNARRREDYSMSANAVSKISKNPFPREWKTTFSWMPSQVLLAPGAASGAFVLRLNDLYDPDYSNSLGNSQPLYFDQLLSATGPYQKFRVDGWRVKIELVNVSPNTSGGSPMPLDIYLMQGATNAVDVDTFNELISSPGVETAILGPSGTTLGQRSWNFNGRLKDYIPDNTSVDLSWCGDYTTTPSSCIFMGVGYRNGDAVDTTAIKLFVKVIVEFDAIVFARDAIGS